MIHPVGTSLVVSILSLTNFV